MKNKYIVIDTWNGEGYSSENGTQIKTFPTKIEAMKYAKDSRKGMINMYSDFKPPYYPYTPYEIDDNVFGWGDEEIGDYGSYQVYELKDNDYAIEILVNVNEVFILSKEQYKDRIKELNEEVFESMFKALTLDNFYAPTDLEEYLYLDDNNINEPFYHGVNDYDYQFRIIK
tara:strand:+ start:1714 stop:2226 length:513 start_codon:yes stop_codon:yes gene_type:complete